jgi:hypothetical protein
MISKVISGLLDVFYMKCAVYSHLFKQTVWINLIVESVLELYQLLHVVTHMIWMLWSSFVYNNNLNKDQTVKSFLINHNFCGTFQVQYKFKYSKVKYVWLTQFKCLKILNRLIVDYLFQIIKWLLQKS